MNITMRMGRLEDEVQHLKTWAGPGQIQALVEGQQGIRADVAKVNNRLDRHERILTKISKTLDQHTEQLARHEGRFSRLEERLTGIEGLVAAQGEMLAELLRRIPEPPSMN
jgi:chromosome segregation ATPase